ncbi:MAG: hypothetical protein OIF35_06875, partial [Cellvibrionaceae bacterium]|nr:hypothetical protein [Cellvibrionaceae bacterium]
MRRLSLLCLLCFSSASFAQLTHLVDNIPTQKTFAPSSAGTILHELHQTRFPGQLHYHGFSVKSSTATISQVSQVTTVNDIDPRISFSYIIREHAEPYTLVDSGSAKLEKRDNSLLSIEARGSYPERALWVDTFSIASNKALTPGDYLISVYPNIPSKELKEAYYIIRYD